MGLILPQTVEIKVSSGVIPHLKERGYDIPIRIGYDGSMKYNLGKSISVHVLDLQPKSKKEVDYYCDYCNKRIKITWTTVYRAAQRKDYTLACKDCRSKKYYDAYHIRYNEQHEHQPEYWDKSWLENAYLTQNRTAQSIADQFHVHVRVIERYIKKYDLNKKYKDPHEKLPYDLLYDLYINQKLTPETIQNMYQTDRSTIVNLLDEYNIPIRTHSESMAIYYNERGGRVLKSEWSQRLWNDENYREQQIQRIREINSSEAKKIKLSCNNRAVPIDIDDWDGFMVPENRRIRTQSQYKLWRENIFERDDYTCQCCGKKGGYLNAHHIESFADNEDLRFDIDNGITLCEQCHSNEYENSFHRIYGTYHNNKQQLIEYFEYRKSKNVEKLKNNYIRKDVW